MKARYILLNILFFTILHAYPSAITFEKNPGRLGDQILNYCKHRWFADKYSLDFFVPEFNYKSFFTLSQQEKSASQLDRSKYIHSIKIKVDTDIRPQRKQAILYIGHYYLTINGVADKYKWPDHLFELTIADETFGRAIRNMLKLCVDMPDITVPAGYIPVAMHIRKGGGFDKPLALVQYKDQVNASTKVRKGSQSVNQAHAFKFPPEQFYLNQLLNLYEYLNRQNLYVHLFTDDKNPEAIVRRLRERIPFENILFDFRKSGNTHNKNVIEDIYAMSRYDYLIRSKSHYPWIAQMMGQHKGIIYPVSYTWEGPFLHINKSHMDIPDREKHSITRIIYSS